MAVTAPEVDQTEAFWNPETAGFGLSIQGTDAEMDVRRLHLQLADADGNSRDWTLLPGLDVSVDAALDQHDERFTFEVSMSLDGGFVPVTGTIRVIDEAQLDSGDVDVSPFAAPSPAQMGEACDAFQTRHACTHGDVCENHVCNRAACGNGQVPIDLNIDGGMGADGRWVYLGDTTGRPDGDHGTCGGLDAGEDVLTFEAPTDGSYSFWIENRGPEMVLYARTSCDLGAPEELCMDTSAYDSRYLAAGNRLYFYVDGQSPGEMGHYALFVERRPGPVVQAAAATVSADGRLLGLDVMGTLPHASIRTLAYEVLDPDGQIVFPADGATATLPFDAINGDAGVFHIQAVAPPGFPAGHTVRFHLVDYWENWSQPVDVVIIEAPAVEAGAGCDADGALATCVEGAYCPPIPPFDWPTTCRTVVAPTMTAARVTAIVADSVVRIHLEGVDAGDDVIGLQLELLDADGFEVSHALLDQTIGQVDYAWFRPAGPVPGQFVDGLDLLASDLSNPDLSSAVTGRIWVVDGAGLLSEPFDAAVEPPGLLDRGAQCSTNPLDGHCQPGDMCDMNWDAGLGTCVEVRPPKILEAVAYVGPDAEALGIDAHITITSGQVMAFEAHLLDAAGQPVADPPNGVWDPNTPLPTWGWSEVLRDGTLHLQRVFTPYEIWPQGIAVVAQIATVELRIRMSDGLISEWMRIPVTPPPVLAPGAQCYPPAALGECPAAQLCLLADWADPYFGACGAEPPPDLSTLEVVFSPDRDLGIRLTGTDVDGDLDGFLLTLFDADGQALPALGPELAVGYRLTATGYAFDGVIRGPAHSFRTERIWDREAIPPEWGPNAVRARVALFDTRGAVGNAVDVAIGRTLVLSTGDVCQPLGIFARCGGADLCLLKPEGNRTCQSVDTTCPAAWPELDLGAAPVAPGHWHTGGNSAGGVVVGGGLCGGGGSAALYSFTAPESGDYTFSLAPDAGAGGGFNPVLSIRSHCTRPFFEGELACNDDVNDSLYSALTLHLDASQAVHVVVDTSGAGAGGPFELDALLR